MNDTLMGIEINKALEDEALRAWPIDAPDSRTYRKRFRKLVNQALTVLKSAGYELQPMPPRRAWPHDETVFHVWREADQVNSIDELKAYLNTMTDEERQKVRIVSGWRDEYGDYMHDLLTMQERDAA